MNYLSRAYGAVKLASKAHAPTVMVVSGVVSMGASVIFASKKTLHLDEVMTPHAEKMAAIQDAVYNRDLPSYTERTAYRDKGVVIRRALVDLSKLYFVPTVFFVGGACLVFGGHRLMLQRNATLAMAFTGVKKAFDAYRQNVRHEFGPEADQAMLHGYKIQEIVDPETGHVATVKQRDWNAPHIDPYNRVFGRGESSQWVDDIAVNKMTIENQKRMAQIRLNNRGYLYLSEVYEALGFPETPVSRIVGWKERINPDGTKDIPVLDFGMDTPMPDDWKYTKDNAIYLDFNCQGLIIGGEVQKALEKA